MLDDAASEMAAIAISLFSKLADRPTSQDIKHRIDRMNASYELPANVLEAVIAEIESSIFTSMPFGTVVLGKGTKLKWLAEKRDSLKFLFWNRYAKFLQYDRKLPPNVLKTLDSSLDDLLELLGDPQDPAPFFRRGLIVGDVQSGKTATYIGLCAKAADAGFKIIIILAGHMVSLRDQTQDRFDEGFAGRDSKLVGKVGGDPSPYGAAKYDKELVVHEYTTKLHDFDTQAAQSAGSPLAGLRGPALLVVKKNKTILQNLFLWLKSLNPVVSGKISSSVLLIDDEADFASVNTGKEYDPRAINKGIRQLLGLFEKSSYVGVTATPFANVFISPDTNTDMLGEDLFPEDFIYSLEPPSNYVGPVQVFEDEIDQIVRPFDDIEPHIPLKHNKDWEVDALPDSLLRAVGIFYISNAIRDARLEGPTDRTMLVNVSPLNAVQLRVSDLLQDHVKILRDDLLVFGHLDCHEAARQSSHISALQKAFEDEYAATLAPENISWSDLLPRLYETNKTVSVMTVNMTSGSQLNYDQYKGVGLRVIAVGGHSLSRGLTLEGLSISYFHRNSSAYDTLLQMGRWFGYRPNYRDLCRLFLTDQAISNYQFITEATQDLKAQFTRMRKRDATPAEFGLKVRASPAGLMMTAAAKMKTAKKVMHGSLSPSLQKLEAFMMPLEKATLESNEAAISRLLSRLAAKERLSDPAGIMWKQQPKELVIDLLDQYRVHTQYLAFRPVELADYLKSSQIAKLQEWDICLYEGDMKPNNRHGTPVKALRRTLIRPEDDQTMFTIGEKSSRRLGSSDDYLIGLSESQRAELAVRVDAVKRANQKPRLSVMANELRERPLLTIYLVQARETHAKAYMPLVNPFTAISLNFPDFEDKDLPEQEIVFVNPIWQKYEESLRADLDEDDAAMNQENDS